VFSETRFLFLLYVLIKNFLGTTKTYQEQFKEHCPPIARPPWPVAMGLVSTRYWILLQL